MTGGARVRVSIVTFLLAEAVLVGLATWARSPLLLALGEVALLSLTAALVLIGRYLALRARYTRERTHRERQAERQQIADDVHDLVGRDLSLIAMRAGLLQLQTEGEQSRLAGELRSSAEDAVRTLHDSLALLSSTPATDPTGADPLVLVEQHRRAGADVSVVGAWESIGATTRVVATSVLREALTNAARHGPGRPVDVRLDQGRDDVRVTVLTHQAPTPERLVPPGRGLRAMRRRLESVGGSLDVDHDERGHVLAARIPVRPSRAARPPAVPPGDYPLRRVLRESAAPLVVAIVIVVGFYTWAEHGATIEPDDQARLRVGMSSEAARSLLPEREAPIALNRGTAHPGGWDCRSYTNANFPLAVATLEVCLDRGAVVRVTDLAEKPLW